jgi:dihydroxyacetone kinase-like predicted kinase
VRPSTAHAGNSGAILAQFLQGVSEGFAGQQFLALGQLADASGRGSRQARQAIAEPREGTMLSVIQVFAQSLGLAREQGVVDLRAGYERALVASRQALADTPNQLAVLRKAGVVDAGAQGFVHLLEGIQEFIRHGRNAQAMDAAPIRSEQGVIASAHVEADAGHRWCTECVVSAQRHRSRRGAVGAGWDSRLQLVIAGTREKLRVHMHVDAPALLFETLASFGEVRAAKADDMHAQQRAVQANGSIAVVVDSAADLPGDSLERLSLHVVPVRINAGSTDYLDKVSLSAQGFYALLRDSDQVVRTSQPPPGDFRRLFEFLLSHHAEVLYVGVSRAISGTLQSGESAGAVLGSRVHVFDSENVSGGQGLLALHAAERAASGVAMPRLLRELEQLRAQTATFAYVRDLTRACAVVACQPGLCRSRAGCDWCRCTDWRA